MGLKALLDSVDDLPEEVKAHYKEADGKFVLDIEGIDDHPKVRGVITANRENIKKRDTYKVEVETLKQRLTGLPDDFDADAYVELKNAAEGKGGKLSDEEKAQMRDQITARVEKKYHEKYAPEIASRDEKISKLDGALRRKTIDDGLLAAMDAADIDPKHKKTLLPFLKTSAKINVEEDGDDFKAVVETDMGPLPLDRFVSEWAGSDAGKLYVTKPTGPDPKGGRQNGAGQKTLTRAQWDQMSQPERMQAAKDGKKVVE